MVFDINADSVDVLDEDQNNVLENNLFAYCLNNPVNMVDYMEIAQ